MNIKTLVVSDFQTNCHIAWGPEKAAIVIDPGDDAASILEFIESKGLSIASYILTHGHMDHISAIADLHKAIPAPVGIHPLDLAWAFDDQNRILPFFSTPVKPSEIARLLEDGQEWCDGGLRYQVLSTPGHTPGSVSLYFPDEQVLFPGDVLFAGSVGRTDLPGGDSRILQQSLTVFSALPDDTQVYPGHGPETTIGQEKATNYFMRL